MENALKVTFATTAQTFTNIQFDSRDFQFPDPGTGIAILYFSEFVNLSTVGNILPIRSITGINTRDDEDGTYVARTEGSDNDYTIDLLRNRIIFTHGDVWRGGYQNIQISGTYGIVANPLTSLSEKYKKYIALAAALMGIRYAVGSSHNESKNITVGGISVSKAEFSAISQNNYQRLQDALNEHLAAFGLTKRRTLISM